MANETKDGMVIGTKINDKIIAEINDRIKVFSRMDGGSPHQLSDEDLKKHHQKIVNMRLISLNEAIVGNKTIRGIDNPIYNYQDKSFECLYPDRTIYGDNNYKRHIPMIAGANIQMLGQYGTYKKTTVDLVCGNIEQLTYMFDLYQTPGGVCIFEFGWDDAFNEHKIKDKDFKNLTNVNGFQELNKKYNYFDKAYSSNGRYGVIIGVVTDFNQSINENGSFNISLTMSSLGSNIFGMDMTTEGGSDLNFEALKDVLKDKYIISKTQGNTKTKKITEYITLGDFFNSLNDFLKTKEISIVIDYQILNKISTKVLSEGFPYLTKLETEEAIKIMAIDSEKAENIQYTIYDQVPKLTRLYSINPENFISRPIKELFDLNESRAGMVAKKYPAALNIGNNGYSNFVNIIKNSSSLINGKYEFEISTINESNKEEIKQKYKDEVMMNTLISNKLIDSLLDNVKTMQDLISGVLEIVNQSLMGYTKLSLKFLDETNVVIINENDIVKSKIESNTTKFNVHTYDNIFRNFNYSSGMTDLQKAHAIYGMKNGFQINIINMKEEKTDSYFDLFDKKGKQTVLQDIKDSEACLQLLVETDDNKESYQNFFNYVFSANKSINRVFNIPLSFTLDGITGMTYGNAFTFNYLMDIYENQNIFPSFFITKVNHTLSSDWETEITGQLLPIKTQ